jgi:hypothetical protein
MTLKTVLLELPLLTVQQLLLLLALFLTLLVAQMQTAPTKQLVPPQLPPHPQSQLQPQI